MCNVQCAEYGGMLLSAISSVLSVVCTAMYVQCFGYGVDDVDMCHVCCVGHTVCFYVPCLVYWVCCVMLCAISGVGYSTGICCYVPCLLYFETRVLLSAMSSVFGMVCASMYLVDYWVQFVLFYAMSCLVCTATCHMCWVWCVIPCPLCCICCVVLYVVQVPYPVN